MLAERPVHRPSSFAGLLELLCELLEELQLTIRNADATDYLGELTGSSKAAKFAKRLMRCAVESIGTMR